MFFLSDVRWKLFTLKTLLKETKMYKTFYATCKQDLKPGLHVSGAKNFVRRALFVYLMNAEDLILHSDNFLRSKFCLKNQA